MGISLYDLDQLVRIDGAFTDVNGTAADPTTVTLEVLSPSNVVTTYTYGGSPEAVIKDSVGNYHADVTALEIGDYFYKWTGTGNAQSADEGQFMIAPGHFA